jgi:spore germination protein GerM
VPGEVLVSSARTAAWGSRVRLLKLTITDGVALANFGPELRAYGGGSARVALIRNQIEETLRQFPSVSEVVIAVDGQTEGVLEP